MSAYLGNPSIPAPVKDRVSTTFAQTVALFKQGRVGEAIDGCNLILQMDPMFDPARKLLEKARNPAAPIDVDRLLPSAPANDPMAEARRALAARDFQRVIHITTEILTNDLMNDEARILGDEARERMEAGPFVDQFGKKFDDQLASGNSQGARATMEKARALDREHPAIARMERALSAAPAPSLGGGTSSFVVDTPAPAAPPSGVGRSAAQASDFGFTFEEEKPAEVSFANFSFDSGTPSPAPGGDALSSFSFEPAAPAAPAKPAPPPAPPAAPASGGFSFDSPAPSAPASGGFSFDATPAAPAAPASGGFSFDAVPAAPAAGGFSFDSAPAAPASGAFSFDATPPQTAPSVGAGSTFDFSAGSMETSPDDQKKIEQYLSEGDRAFDAGDNQTAIDLWSRIFLIDVTNEQASERIERAKSKRREAEQKIEGMLTAAIQAYDKKDHDGARARFAEVLRHDPGNSTAEEYMERLTTVVTEGGAPAVSRPYVPPPSVPDDDFAASFMEDDSASLSEAPLMPPDEEDEDAAPVAAKPAKGKKGAAAKTKAAATAGKKSAPMGLIAAIVVVLLAAGGWMMWSRMSGGPAEADPGATAAVFSRASSLAAKGQYDQAIAMLRDVKPGDPQYDKALGMIADLQSKKTQAAQVIDGRPAAQFYDDQIALATAAFAAHDYNRAKLAFEQAQRVKPIPPDLRPQYDQASQQVAKLASAKALFAERRYQDAIANLQQLLTTDPENKNVREMIADAHFNLGAVALQEENTAAAVQEFDQVLKVYPNDELAQRSKSLAQRYEKEKKDLLYRIYVKYLPLRQQPA